MTDRIGKIGIWTGHTQWPGDPGEVRDTAAELEDLGYAAVWLSSLPGAGSGQLTLPEAILAATNRLHVATGVLEVWTSPAAVVAENHTRLQKLHGGRFVLGLGVSHAEVVDVVTDGGYTKPLAKMSAYLDELDAAVPPVPVEERVLAALGPKALELAARRAGGVHPYLVTPGHTATARAAIGAGRWLAPEQKVVLSTDPVEARRVARRALALYLTLPNYLNNLRRLGFEDADFADRGSDRLVDALVAWGALDDVERRLREHLDAGADHVAVQVLSTGDLRPLPRAEWREAAPLVTALAS